MTRSGHTPRLRNEHLMIILSFTLMTRLRLALAATALLSTVACRQSAAANVATGPEAVVRAHLEAENAHDVARILATLADTVAMHVIGANGRDSVSLLDHDALRHNYERAVSAVPRSHFTALSQIVSGPWVMSREEVSGLPDGTRDEGLAMYRVVDGKIAGLWILNTREGR